MVSLMLLLVIIEFLKKTANCTIRCKTSKVGHRLPKSLFSCLFFVLYFIELQWIYFHFTGSIRVYCRVRPFLSGQSNYLSTVDHIEEGNITINTPSKHGKGWKSFSFNKVYGPSATQG